LVALLVPSCKLAHNGRNRLPQIKIALLFSSANINAARQANEWATDVTQHSSIHVATTRLVSEPTRIEISL
jgi:hypothetical protein